MSDNVNQLPMAKEVFMLHVDINAETGCWEWNRSRNNLRGGYGQKRIGGRRSGKVYGAHRLAWWIFNGYEPQGYFVCHRCDNPPCCNPDHLFLGSEADNVHDMHSKDRGFIPINQRGEAHHSAKLCEQDVINIKADISKGHSLSTIAKRYGVSKQAIWRIKDGRSWNWLMTR